jgi:hypothetical protein
LGTGNEGSEKGLCRGWLLFSPIRSFTLTHYRAARIIFGVISGGGLVAGLGFSKAILGALHREILKAGAPKKKETAPRPKTKFPLQTIFFKF